MNGLENISNKILAEASEEAKAILAEAERQAASISQVAEAQAAQERELGEKSIIARRADLADKARLAASLEHRRLLATTRQQMIAQVFSDALERLTHLPADQYRALLIRLTEQAIADGEGGELLLNERDRAVHGEAIVTAINTKRIEDKVSQVSGRIHGVVDSVLQGKLPSLGSLKNSVKDAAGDLSQNKRITLAADFAPILGGVVIRRGKIELNCALEVTIRMLSESMAFEVSDLLFPKGA